MKSQRIISAAAGLLLVSVFALNFDTIEAKSKYSHPVKKTRSKSKMVETYFEVQEPGSSNVYVIIGRGSATSGTLDGYEIGCVVGTIDAAGSATGTYTYNPSTETMSLNGTVTPSGQASFTVLGSPVEFSSSPISITCGPNIP